MAGNQVVALKSKTARPREFFAKAITEQWQSTLEGIFKTGLMLETAQAELAHGEWLLMIENDLPFGARTAQRLKKIANDERLRDETHGSHLPVSWRTLIELTKLDDETFALAIEDGRINPRMERKDALALRPPKPRKPKVAPVTSILVKANPISPIDRCAMQVRELIFDFTNEIPSDQWSALIVDLRAELDDIEETLAKRRAENHER